jgi:hypothetical protein
MSTSVNVAMTTYIKQDWFILLYVTKFVDEYKLK